MAKKNQSNDDNSFSLLSDAIQRAGEERREKTQRAADVLLRVETDVPLNARALLLLEQIDRMRSLIDLTGYGPGINKEAEESYYKTLVKFRTMLNDVIFEEAKDD